MPTLSDSLTTTRFTLLPEAALLLAAVLGGACAPSAVDQAARPGANPAAVTPYVGPPRAIELTAVADARVRSTRPDKNYGTSSYLRVRDDKTSWRSFLKFEVAGVSGTITAATLALYVDNGSPDGGTVYAVASDWEETEITWNNAPSVGDTPLASLGLVNDHEWATLDVTAAVSGNGTYSFALVSSSTNSAYYESREGRYAPLLLITVDSAGTAEDGGLPVPEDGGLPPPEDGSAPLEEDGGLPPQEDGGLPPPEDGGVPPPEDGGVPPPEDGGAPPPPMGTGIWMSPEELAQRPTSGPAWEELLDRANSSCGTPDLSNQDDNTNVCIMAKALVYARTQQTSYRDDVVDALSSIVSSGTYSGRALALGRELGAYVIAADLISLATVDPALDALFRDKLSELLVTYTSDGPDSLIECHELRPNNWGTHCGGSRAAVAAYLGDDQELARVAQVFRGWLGDRSAYAEFSYGDLSWQCDPGHPVGINPAGCTKDGHNIDGVVPDDQRRAGSFTWPPPQENYVYEALQGALLQAVILERAGYEVFAAEDQALRRAFTWLDEQADFPAEGDDTWQPHLVNYFYGTSFPEVAPARPGKNVGFTDWTHGS